MQIRKDDKYKRILTVAKTEFLSNGYKKTSMRAISKKSGIGLSNLYNYFENKDALFEEVLKPLLLYIEKSFDTHNDEENLSIDNFSSQEYLEKYSTYMVSLVENYKEELRLLLFHAYGSSLENFRESYAEKHTKVAIAYFAEMKSRYPHINTNVSPLFLQVSCSWTLTILEKIVTRDDLTHEELETFMLEYLEFGTAGWKKIMRV